MYNKFVPLELNPNRSRTDTDRSRDVGNEMDSLGYRLGDGPDMPRRVLGVSPSRPQKTGNLKFRNSAPRATCTRVAQIE